MEIQWIQIEEAKPKEGYRVLVCWEPSRGCGIKEGTFSRGEFYRDLGCSPYSGVTHWAYMSDHPTREDREKLQMQQLQKFLAGRMELNPRTAGLILYRINEVRAGDYVYISHNSIGWAKVDCVADNIICAGGLTWKINFDEPFEGTKLVYASWTDKNGYSRTISSWVKAADMKQIEAE